MPDPKAKTKPVPPGQQKKDQDFLKAHGHKVADVNKLDLTTERKRRVSLCELHGLKGAEDERIWRMAGGKPWNEE